MNRYRNTSPRAAWVLSLTVPLWVQPAMAQNAGDQPPPQGGAGAGAGAGAGGGAGAGAAAGAANVQIPANLFTQFGLGAPGAPTGPIGGGNATDSSSRPLTGDQQDGFDLAPASGGPDAVHGSANGPLFLPNDDNALQGGVEGGEASSSTYTVRRGDTLWGICDQYLKNPYAWPKIWSYNPQVQNPHWVYPGDELALRPRGESVTGEASASASPSAAGERAKRDVNGSASPNGKPSGKKGLPQTVYLRDEGFMEDSSDETWGTLSGSPLDHMFLSNEDEAYIQLDNSREPEVGQSLTLFRPVRTVAGGKVIQFLGTVRIDEWNAKQRVARAKVTESLDVIERGVFVGPVGRAFEVVPPSTNGSDVRAHVVASVHPHNFWGQNQVVFIDKGADDGLAVGNRLSVIRQGDAWQKSLVHAGAGLRISAEAADQPPIETTPTGDQGRYPEEAFGELRVISLKHHTATCLLTQTNGEIEVNDLAVAKKGY